MKDGGDSAKTMFAAERRSELAKIVNERGSVSVHELSKNFQVTLMTINRDLRDLSREGKLVAVRGGAISNNYSIHGSFSSQRINAFIEIKQRLAAKALDYIQQGDSIVLDSSTTSFVLARTIAKRHIQNITVITNSIAILEELMPYRNINLMGTGGNTLDRSSCFVGPLSELVLSQLRADKLFFSVAGLNENGDLTDGETSEASVKRKMIEISQKKILLIGSYKLHKYSLNKVASLNEIDTMICDLAKNDGLFLERFFEIKSLKIETV
jgi:DeoR family fructose operon transcriptional repressor